MGAGTSALHFIDGSHTCIYYYRPLQHIAVPWVLHTHNNQHSKLLCLRSVVSVRITLTGVVGTGIDAVANVDTAADVARAVCIIGRGKYMSRRGSLCSMCIRIKWDMKGTGGKCRTVFSV